MTLLEFKNCEVGGRQKIMILKAVAQLEDNQVPNEPQPGVSTRKSRDRLRSSSDEEGQPARKRI